MNIDHIKTNLSRLYALANGSTLQYEPNAESRKLLEAINALEPSLREKTDTELQSVSRELKKKPAPDADADNLIMAFALVRESARRTLNMRPFDVQILGGLAMYHGRLAEMKTGEGKTLTAVFPAFLRGLGGKGVHILTFNDYLARRDAEWMGPVYRFLGLRAGHIHEGMTISERKKGYTADITYLTAKEAGFDYLRDSLAYNRENIVQRPFHFALIDEADSILIDEARIPLVLAGSAEDHVPDSYFMAELARRLEMGTDFDFDEYARNVHLTESGQQHAENLLRCGNLYAQEQYDSLTRLYCALHAEYLLNRDVDYIVRDGKIELVDDFTGRVADKRRWPDGLQAAIEAKENIDIQTKGNILNSITLQHFIQLYPGRCGMTATSRPSENEFKAFYGLDISVIPSNKTCVRADLPDVLFRTRIEKNIALADEIALVHQTGRPILVGTRSVEESAQLADVLQSRGLSCNVLNAKHDDFEAEIIAQAGVPGAVTISTNMAGRGTDIRLGGTDEREKEQVTALGGLYVIGTNRHESRRIDDQLRGRAGRQGDPGSSCFFISLEDDLYKKYRLHELLPEKATDLSPAMKPVIRRETDRIQRICEGQNLEIKKTLTRYSSLLENQRRLLFIRREEILSRGEALRFFKKHLPKKYRQTVRFMDTDNLERICRQIMLVVIDRTWMEYLQEIADIRESIHLKRIGGQNPFFEFQKLAIRIFDDRLGLLDTECIRLLREVNFDRNGSDLERLGIKAPSATWTYLINDNPFEYNLGIQLIGDAGLQIGAGILGPLLALKLFFEKRRKAQSN